MQKFKLSYDDYNITKSIIDDIIENYQEYGYDEKPDEYKVNSNINWNTYQEEYQWAWEDFLSELGKAFHSRYKTCCAKVEGKNLNWRGASGSKYINIKSENNFDAGLEIIRNIQPNCDFSIEATLNKGRLLITIYHHDCPTGSIFLLKPCAYSTYEKESA